MIREKAHDQAIAGTPLQSRTFGHVCCHVSVAISSSQSPPPTMALSWRTLIMKKGRSANSHSPLAASPPPMTEGKEEQRKRQKQTRHEEPPMTEDEEEQRKRRRKTRRSPMTEDSDGQRKQRKQKKEKRHKEAHMNKDKAERVVPYGAKPDLPHVTEDNDSDATTAIFGRSPPSPSWWRPLWSSPPPTPPTPTNPDSD